MSVLRSARQLRAGRRLRQGVRRRPTPVAGAAAGLPRFLHPGPAPSPALAEADAPCSARGVAASPSPGLLEEALDQPPSSAEDWLDADVSIHVHVDARAPTPADPSPVVPCDACTHEASEASVAGQMPKVGGEAAEHAARVGPSIPQEDPSPLPRLTVPFDRGSDALAAAAPNALRGFIARHGAALAPSSASAARIDLIGHGGSTGPDAGDAGLARRRAETVRDFLGANGMSAVHIRVLDGAEGARDEPPTSDGDGCVVLMVAGDTRRLASDEGQLA
jgi:outer membrane protein OmpA-like peptidoglycan-associated protein